MVELQVRAALLGSAWLEPGVCSVMGKRLVLELPGPRLPTAMVDVGQHEDMLTIRQHVTDHDQPLLSMIFSSGGSYWIVLVGNNAGWF